MPTSSRSTMVLAVAAALVLGLPAAPASAAVTSQSCPGGREPWANTWGAFGDPQSVDYADAYEVVVKSPRSPVSLLTGWTCRSFTRVVGVSAFAFVTILTRDSGVGGSVNTSRSCDWAFARDVESNFTAGYAIPTMDTSLGPDIVKCIYQMPTNNFFAGHTIEIHMWSNLEYDWEAAASTHYRFRGELYVHSEVPQPGNRYHDHFVCYQAIPGLACG